jgi:hypothetical protein
MLNKKISGRMCNLNKIKETEFFENFEWNDLVDFKLKPPYTPKFDTSFNEIKENIGFSKHTIIKFENYLYVKYIL